MILHSEPSFAIYFGDKQDVLLKPGIRVSKKALDKDDFYEEGFAKIRQNLRIDSLVVLDQLHVTHGVCIDEHTPLIAPLHLFAKTGDMLISNRKAVGIGVLTADCLPIVLYDALRHVVAIMHAGWRGSVAGIVTDTIKKMVEHYGCRPKDMKVYFGPSAKICCYEVQPDFLAQLEKFSYANQLIRKHDKRYYFDVPLLNKRLLLEAGVRQQAIHEEYNECTICNDSFHSYRREAGMAGCQATVVFLK